MFALVTTKIRLCPIVCYGLTCVRKFIHLNPAMLPFRTKAGISQSLEKCDRTIGQNDVASRK